MYDANTQNLNQSAKVDTDQSIHNGGCNTNTPQADKAMSYGGLFILDEECLQYKLFDGRSAMVIWKGSQYKVEKLLV